MENFTIKTGYISCNTWLRVHRIILASCPCGGGAFIGAKSMRSLTKV